MKRVGILIPEGQVIGSSIIATFEILRGVNNYLISTGQLKDDFFKTDLIGLSRSVDLYGGIVSFTSTKTIGESGAMDLIIISTITGEMDLSLHQNSSFIPWIVEQRTRYRTEIASLCTGAFLLAETGLIDGKSISTHWSAAESFKRRYPEVELIPEAVITDDNGIYSSGGAFSMLNLILYLVEKFCGRETAIWCSKMFEIDFDRINQNQFVIFNGQKGHKDEKVKEAQIYIENNYGEKLSVESLARTFASSRRNFIRRFKNATMNTPLEYIQRVKIEAAKKSLESREDNINEVMLDVGYTDSKAFRMLFRKYTGLTPIEYKRKYQRISMN
jgi:transcriptional regulator GlxA family with amidase domain